MCLGWSRLRESTLLDGHIGVQVNSRGFDGLVTEPESNHRRIDTTTLQFHRQRVAKHMRSDTFFPKSGTFLSRLSGVFSEEVLDTITRELSTSSVWKEWLRGTTGPLTQPSSERSYGFLSQRRRALLAPLTFAADMRSRSQYDVLATKTDQL